MGVRLKLGLSSDLSRQFTPSPAAGLQFSSAKNLEHAIRSPTRIRNGTDLTGSPTGRANSIGLKVLIQRDTLSLLEI